MPNPIITVYTQPSCQPCKRTMWLLDREGVEYSTVDISTNPEAREAIIALGYMQAPVVIVNRGDTQDETHWAGLRPEMIQEFCVKPTKENQ